MTILRFYSSPAISDFKKDELLAKLQKINSDVKHLATENCYHAELDENKDLNISEVKILSWILSSPLKPESLKNDSNYKKKAANQLIIEIGPRFNFSTPDSSNAVQICQSVGLHSIVRLEVSKRYLITFQKDVTETDEFFNTLAAPLHDRMTECVYTAENLPRDSFNESLNRNIEPWFEVPLLEQGRKAMEDVNKKLGLAFDAWDMKFYTDLFLKKLKRNPTSVELFDLAQSNSEHSRHWFFKGKICLNDEELDESLIDMIASTQETSNNNNVIKFGDNSSAILGYKHLKVCPENVTGPSKMLWREVSSDIIFTAETHNMPTGVAPFSGATTGTGGRIRDVQSVGRGGHTVAGTAGYCVGCLHIPGYDMPWEVKDFKYPMNFASPLDILIEASNGASDYGNKFGEPVISGFVQSYGMTNLNGEREEFIKPIMFSGGIGYMPHNMIKKKTPQKDMYIAKIGGPVYRIGVGGGAASSVPVQGDRDHVLDFGAVQRGDAEMGNRLNRAVRACLESNTNPIESIHDQGAGGNGNVLKEIVEPQGAIIFTKEFQLGDPTITTLELWGAEYQENNALLCSEKNKQILSSICERERCPVSFVGKVTGDGYVTLIEDYMSNIKKYDNLIERTKNKIPFHMHLDSVLGNIPRKHFNLKYVEGIVKEVDIGGVTVEQALQKVLRLVSVASKRYLTTKVDRCVGGLIAQQQCVGPLHTPLADFGMIALSTNSKEGSATSIGTHCLKGSLSPDVVGRMALGEALTNLVFAGISNLKDVKCSGNWMWPGKTGHEGATLVLACRALVQAMKTLGVAVDGGKDSLSMKAQVGGETVRSPGTLVVSTYAPCPDVGVKVDPALKEESSELVWVQITPLKFRLGGTAFSQTHSQLGNNPCDADNLHLLKRAFITTQVLVKDHKILSGHDISDGGIITTLIEMSIGGIRGINIDIPVPQNVTAIEALFSEELGLILEISSQNIKSVLEIYEANEVPVVIIGKTLNYGMDSEVKIKVNGISQITKTVLEVYRYWEETSYQLDRLQANPSVVQQEWDGLGKRKGVSYKCNFDPTAAFISNKNVKVAVLREEGTNGDREMITSLLRANFDVYDVTMSDLHNNKITLDAFQGVVFPGGFSYADTLGSAKGWAAGIIFSERLSTQFKHFRYNRNDTFALGVCNGCQLMALLGWVDTVQNDVSTQSQIFLNHNMSERFECRWSAVRINDCKSKTWLKDMSGSVLGVWVAHAEGKFTFKDKTTKELLRNNQQIALQYVDDDDQPTEIYPCNPNGSEDGVAGLVSEDGRFLSMMPHPERCTIMWQCPLPSNNPHGVSPWAKLFNNAYEWASRLVH